MRRSECIIILNIIGLFESMHALPELCEVIFRCTNLDLNSYFSKKTYILLSVTRDVFKAQKWQEITLYFVVVVVVFLPRLIFLIPAGRRT